MKRIVSFLTVFILIVSACNRADEIELQNYTNIEGNYIGTFERNGNISNVEFQLENNEFSGNSDIDKFPAICNGNFNISTDTIVFENTCGWYANFDWTLILNGNWHYTFDNNVLTMEKSNGDKYILTKQ